MEMRRLIELTPTFIHSTNTTNIAQYQKEIIVLDRYEETFRMQGMVWCARVIRHGSSRVMSLILKSLDRKDVSVLVQYTAIFDDFSTSKAQELSYDLETEKIPLGRNTMRFERERLVILQITVIEKVVCQYTKTVSRTLSELLAQEKLTDVTLVVGDKEFKAHKVILAAHSPVFMAAFEHDMQEKQENRVIIENVESDVFHEMLQFMYNTEDFSIETDPSELLAIADRYQITKLKDHCENAMIGNVRMNNVLDNLVFADRYNTNNLKHKAVDYIINHLNDVVYKPQFDSIMRSHGHLATIIFQQVAKKQLNNC